MVDSGHFCDGVISGVYECEAKSQGVEFVIEEVVIKVYCCGGGFLGIFGGAIRACGDSEVWWRVEACAPEACVGVGPEADWDGVTGCGNGGVPLWAGQRGSGVEAKEGVLKDSNVV